MESNEAQLFWLRVGISLWFPGAAAMRRRFVFCYGVHSRKNAQSSLGLPPLLLGSVYPIGRSQAPSTGVRPKELATRGEHMPFVHVGSAAESVIAGTRGSNIVPFPQDVDLTRDRIISMSCTNLELARDILLRLCGVTGTARIFILMIEEMIEANSGDVVESNKLSKKISRLAKVFAQESDSHAKIEPSG